jgi:hypothetical protein
MRTSAECCNVWQVRDYVLVRSYEAIWLVGNQIHQISWEGKDFMNMIPIIRHACKYLLGCFNRSAIAVASLRSFLQAISSSAIFDAWR